MHEAVALMLLLESHIGNVFYNECANRYINRVMRKKLEANRINSQVSKIKENRNE